MEDTLKLIEDRENELHAVYERMDAIQDELYLAYAMKDFDGKTLLKNVVNVSLNSSLVLRNNTIADLEGTIFQWQFEGDKSLTEHKEDLLRGFVQDSLDQADEQLLQTKGITSLKSWFCHKVVEEVLLGVMWITNPPIDGEANFECLPLRMRWCPFDYDNRGLAWIAPKYTRSGAQIMAEYGDGVKRTFTGKSFDVVNFWDREKNQIYVNKELIFEQPNVFKEVPANIVLPVLGLALEETDKRETDVLHDVFFANKRIVEELNRSVSIAQTKAMETVKPAMIENKENPDAAPADPPPGMGEVKQGKMGPRPVWEALQKPDINQAFQYGQAIISKAAQQGGINDIDLGNVNPAASSLVVTAQAGIRQKFNRTSIEALEVMYRGLARLMIIQNQQYDKLKVGRKGIRHVYSLGAIGIDYSIQCRHMTKTKELEIANASVAASFRGWLPDEWILSELLQFQDPADVLRKMAIQRARSADPALEYFELALQYAEEAETLGDEVEADAKKIESMRLTDICVRMLQQAPVEAQPQEKPNTNALAAVAARGGLPSAAKPFMGGQ